MRAVPDVVWYSVEAAPPPVGVLVWVAWGGNAPFLASRVARPGSRTEAWAVKDDNGRPVLLPCPKAPPPDPRRPWAGWHTIKGDRPELWRPQQPERWALPLPPPARVDRPGADDGPRLAAVRMRFQAVEEAEAAELAREMEHMRSIARDAGPGGSGASGRLAAGESEAPDKQWWLDPLAVTYSAPGAISLREVEGRLMRAFIAERWVRVERPGVQTFGGVLGAMAAATPTDVSDDPLPLRPAATGRDHDDMLTALAWLRVLLSSAEDGGRDGGGETALRLRGRVPAMSWREIGRAVGVSHEAARQMHRRAIDAVWQRANGWR